MNRLVEILPQMVEQMDYRRVGQQFEILECSSFRGRKNLNVKISVKNRGICG